MKKEICVIALSFVFDLFFFYFLFGVLRWNFLFSAVLAVLLYMALTLLLKPARKIGKVKVETLRDGEHLSEKLEEARADLKSIERSMTKIRDLELKVKGLEEQPSPVRLKLKGDALVSHEKYIKAIEVYTATMALRKEALFSSCAAMLAATS